MGNDLVVTGSTGSGSGGGSQPIELDTINSISPTIRDETGREVTPVYTESLRGKSDNDNRVHKTLCGQTNVEAVGEDGWQVTLEGLVLKEQLETLFAMRPSNNEITVISDARVHRDVEFDRFIYEQRDELNTGQFRYRGNEVEQPLFRYQLQSKDDDQ